MKISLSVLGRFRFALMVAIVTLIGLPLLHSQSHALENAVDAATVLEIEQEYEPGTQAPDNKDLKDRDCAACAVNGFVSPRLIPSDLAPAGVDALPWVYAEVPDGTAPPLFRPPRPFS